MKEKDNTYDLLKRVRAGYRACDAMHVPVSRGQTGRLPISDVSQVDIVVDCQLVDAGVWE
jgi:hypothetical protein